MSFIMARVQSELKREKLRADMGKFTDKIETIQI